jgi:predicted nucleic acid-binding protein
LRYCYWDASALGKRYVPETGTALVNYLFAAVPADRMMALYLGIGEVVSVIVRRHNAGAIGDSEFAHALAEFGAGVIDASEFRLQSVTDDLIRASLPLIRQHSLNATDAIVLRSALDVLAALRTGGDDLVLVTSDVRLVTAAQAEGLVTIDPETDSQDKIDALIGTAS